MWRTNIPADLGLCAIVSVDPQYTPSQIYIDVNDNDQRHKTRDSLVKSSLFFNEIYTFLTSRQMRDDKIRRKEEYNTRKQ